MDRAMQPEEPYAGTVFMIRPFWKERVEFDLRSLGSMPPNAEWWKLRMRQSGGSGPLTSGGWVTLFPILKAHRYCSRLNSTWWTFSHSISHFMLTTKKEIHCLIRRKNGILENRRNLEATLTSAHEFKPLWSGSVLLLLFDTDWLPGKLCRLPSFKWDPSHSDLRVLLVCLFVWISLSLLFNWYVSRY